MKEAGFFTVMGELLFVVAAIWLVYTGAASAFFGWLFSFRF